jgi:M6 family metalloprotease-like protein
MCRSRRRRIGPALLAAAATFLTAEAGAQTRGPTFLGLTSPSGQAPVFWEGRTDYRVHVRPKGEVRAIMLFARFPDAESEESTKVLYDRLIPEGAAFLRRASYGEMSLTVDIRHRWISMDQPSTSPSYDQDKFATHKTYVAEVVRKADKDIDFSKYDVVYIVGSRNKGTPKSPTWIALPGDGIRAGTAEVRHAVTFGNDCRNRNWGWQTLAHETGHVFGLPDLYNYKLDTPRYKDFQRHVGCWDLMGNQQTGSEYLAWHKYKLGWLSDPDILIAQKGSTTGVITPIDDRGGIKAIVVPFSDAEAYVVEVRSRDMPSRSEPGVLCYRVSLAIRDGQGPIQVIPARPDDDDPALERKYLTLYHALFFEGTVISDVDRGIKISILGRDRRGYRIGVTR